MPQAVSEVFDPLRNEFVGLHQLWALFRTLFGHSEARIDLLNRVSSAFFGYTQVSMYLDIILALCRHTDPAGNVTKKGDDRRNLTLERLVNVVTADDAAFGRALATNEWAAVKAYRDAEFEEIRSKRIAHNDFTKMTARHSGQPIGWPSHEKVGRFLDLCIALMDKVQQHYIGSPFPFDLNASDGQKGGEVLIRVLGEYAKWHDAGMEDGSRLQWGIAPPKDYHKKLAALASQ
jgi:hypothetical protein